MANSEENYIYPVADSHGRRFPGKLDLTAGVDVETGEVAFYSPIEEIEKLKQRGSAEAHQDPGDSGS